MKKYTIWTMIFILEILAIIFLSSTSYSADTLTKVAFSTSEFLLELDTCIDKEMIDCIYDTNSISIDYEDNIKMYMYEKISVFNNIEQYFIITGEHKFLEKKLENLLYILLDIEDLTNPIEFHKALTSVKETGKGTYKHGSNVYDIEFIDNILTVTLKDY